MNPSDNPTEYQQLFVGKNFDFFKDFMAGRFPGWYVYLDGSEIKLATNLSVHDGKIVRSDSCNDLM